MPLNGTTDTLSFVCYDTLRKRVNPGGIKMPGRLLLQNSAQQACLLRQPSSVMASCIHACICTLHFCPNCSSNFGQDLLRPSNSKSQYVYRHLLSKRFTNLAPPSLPFLSPLLLHCVCSPILTSFALSMSKPIFLLQFASSCSHFRINKSMVEGSHLDAISLKFFFFQKIPQFILLGCLLGCDCLG